MVRLGKGFCLLVVKKGLDSRVSFAGHDISQMLDLRASSIAKSLVDETLSSECQQAFCLDFARISKQRQFPLITLYCVVG